MYYTLTMKARGHPHGHIFVCAHVTRQRGQTWTTRAPREAVWWANPEHAVDDREQAERTVPGWQGAGDGLKRAGTGFERADQRASGTGDKPNKLITLWA